MDATGNLDLKLLSLNVRGIRDFKKRKSIINWIIKQKADIAFLQETYSTVESEAEWRYQWRGNLFFAHGSNHSKGTLVLIRKELDFEVKNVIVDNNGRFIIMRAEIQNSPFVLANIYAPNECNDQVHFYNDLSQTLDSFGIDPDCNVIIGGDFNITFDPEVDCFVPVESL